MRVLFINPLDCNYGSTYRARNLMRAIWQVAPDSLYVEGIDRQQLRNKDLEQDAFPTLAASANGSIGRWHHYTRSLPSFTESFNADFVWIQKFLPMTANLVRQRHSSGLATIVDWDDFDAQLQNRWWKRLLVDRCETKLPPLVSVITTHSNTIAERARTLGCQQVVIMPQTLSEEVLGDSVSADDARDKRDAPKVFVYLCSLNEGGSRDVDVILECAKKLCAEKVPFRLLIVGGGEYERRVQQTVNSMGLGGIVRITGVVAQKQATNFLRSADFGLAYMRDNIGNRARVSFKVLEYLAAGLPVIGALTGESHRLFHDKLSWSCSRPSELLRGMRFAVGDELKLVDFSAEIRHHYDWRVNIPAVNEVLRNASQKS